MDADGHRPPNHPDRDTTPDRAPTAAATSGPSAAPPEVADATQLRRLDLGERPDWRLDDSTKAIGRHGIEQARAALASARRRQAELDLQHNRAGEHGGGRATAA